MKIRLCVSVLFLIFILQKAKSQNNTKALDSLQNELQKTQSDTAKIKLFDALSYTYSNIDADKGLTYAHFAENLSAKINWKKGIAAAYSNYGVNYTTKCDYKKAIHYNLKALKVYNDIGNKHALGGVLANISLLYLKQSDYAKALENGFKALTFLEESNDSKTIAVVQENIGTIYLEQKNFSKTLYYYTLAYENYEKIDHKDGMARNIGNQGIVLNEQGNYKEALKSHMLALKHNESIGAKNSIQINLANIGITYCHLKDYTKAIAYHLKAYQISKKLKDQKSISINLGNAGEVYLLLAKNSSNALQKNNNLYNAIDCLKKATAICKEINFKGPLAEFSSNLSDAYFFAGNHELALETYKQYTNTKDSIFASETRLQIATLESKREINLKKKDIILKNQEIQISLLKLMNKKNEQVIYLTWITLLLVIIMIMYVFFHVRSNRHKKILSEIANAQSHEVRAPLARILGLINLFDKNNPTSDINKDVIKYIHVSALELDQVIKKIVDKTYKTHFNLISKKNILTGLGRIIRFSYILASRKPSR